MTDPVSAIIESSGLLRPGECLRCEVCCRFPSAASPLAPYFSHAEMEQAVAAGMPADAFPPGRYGPGFSARLVPEEPAFRCPAFRPATNDCAAYAARPLDCRLYPFMLLYDADGKEVFLGLDTYCPAVAPSAALRALAGEPAVERAGAACIRDAADKLSSLLDGAWLEKVVASRGIVGAWNDHVRRLRPLPALTRALCRTDLGLARMTLTARERLLPFFEAHRGAHSFHAFAPICVWSDIFDLHYKISGERLLVFAEEDGDCFLICPPLGTGDVAPPGRGGAGGDAATGAARRLAADPGCGRRFRPAAGGIRVAHPRDARRIPLSARRTRRPARQPVREEAPALQPVRA